MIFLFLVLMIVVFKMSGLKDHFNLLFLQQKIKENIVSGLFIFIVIFSLGNLIQIPGWIFLAAAVLTLGKTWGAAATYIAATISCITTFLIIRYLGGDALRQIPGSVKV